jgi:hypothetical protein
MDGCLGGSMMLSNTQLVWIVDIGLQAFFTVKNQVSYYLGGSKSQKMAQKACF